MPSSNVRRRLRLAVLTAVLAAAALVTPAAATAATGSTVVGVASGRCLDVVGNSTAAKTRVNIYDCVGQANQAWTFTAAGELRVYDGAMCLDVAGASTSSPADAQIYPCNGGANQKWRINADGTITGVQSGLCLDVTGAGTANSTLVGLYTCNGGANQKWRTALGDTQPPSVPGNPRVTDLVCDAVTFSWDAAIDNVGVAFYDVYHDGQLMKSVNTLSTSLTVVGGVTWGLYVNARDAAGNVSQASATVPVTPPQCQPDTQAPSAPANLTGRASGTTVTLNWAAATDNIGVRAYDVYRGGAKVGAVTGTATAPPATTFVDSGLAPNTTYSYYVVARDAQANVSPPSAATTVTTGAACGDSVCAVTQIATDTDIPWGLVTLPDGTILYSRRDAHDIVHLNPATGTKTSVGTVPGVDNTDGEGGLLGLAISAGFSSDHWLYVMHTSPTDNRIVRIKLENEQLGTEQVLLTGLLRNKFHNGGRLRFGPDGKLYASTGDAQNGDNAQNKASLNGKILRLNPDGSVPSDNPFGNAVWSYGHRNPQGLAFDSQGRLWEQEFGNAVMDETNLITKGGNYGWPACEGTSGTCGTAGFIAPKRTYSTADGSCSGIAIVRDVLYVACERGTRMYREVISGSDLTDVQAYFNGTYGRLRTVEPAPDGGLWLTTTNNGDKDSIPDNSNERIFHVALGG
ncbi:Glucose/arabinose dehydrogenase, beta-propeller fold [Amycolatopsis pretoriensis]|uniref:Glucose/arabinose dehydrogenase, beta-propeller fold n=1 Tax=Amycolatopsis pretoriensis TaxID=218821 RepID=A0A1H5QEB5_9PSEU|nr:PQQ-dependent sugar dehydrogenase [Amycolatopsis pretoriensis]SEF24194.1 Glucose/arabinose dehydrogenase, beta-propeller fold [Amycolatopsis pretoriensis]